MEEKKQEKKLSFDEVLRELETIVMQLNSGTLPLEESMTAFESSAMKNWPPRKRRSRR